MMTTKNKQTRDRMCDEYMHSYKGTNLEDHGHIIHGFMHGWDACESHMQAQIAPLIEALERITGMCEVHISAHGDRVTEEIYASKIAREALSAYQAAQEE